MRIAPGEKGLGCRVRNLSISLGGKECWVGWVKAMERAGSVAYKYMEYVKAAASIATIHGGDGDDHS